MDAVQPPEEPKRLLPGDAKPQEDRLTLLLKAHHQQPGSNPTSFEVAASVPLGVENEQAYQRRVKLRAGSAQPLDLGWVDRPGYVAIQSLVGNGLARVPSEAERAEIDATIVRLLCNGQPAVIVRPGRFAAFEVDAESQWSLEVTSGEAAVNLFVIPRAL